MILLPIIAHNKQKVMIHLNVCCLEDVNGFDDKYFL